MLQYCASTYRNYTIDIVQQVIVSPNDVIASLFKNGISSFVKAYCVILWHYHGNPCSVTVLLLYLCNCRLCTESYSQVEGSILIGYTCNNTWKCVCKHASQISSIGRIQLSIWIQRSNDQSVGDLQKDVSILRLYIICRAQKNRVTIQV